ncbi:MAG: CRISPR-associated endonuclease Cas1 [Bacillota bacterium]|nr:CRISPR-associated endonuclease Cas1 [Bacillota bacterium]
MARTLYLFKSGELKRNNNTLKFVSKEESVVYPIYQIRAIYVFGEITVNKRLLSFLNSHGVTVCFFNYYGNYIGSFFPAFKRNGNVLIQQVNCLQDTYLRNTLISEFLLTQFDNQLSLLKYYRKKGEDLDDWIAEIEVQKSKFLLLDRDEDFRDRALLYEARIKQLYYHALDIVLLNTDFSFEARSMHPPLNEVNALLSFGYSLLYSDFLAAIHQTPLCSQISFIHSCSKAEDSLKFDLADMFKSVFVDRLVLRIIRKGWISKDHFTFGDGCFLNEEGKKLFIREYDAFLEKTKIDSRNEQYYSNRNLLVHECNNIVHYICDQKEYVGYRMGW